jgi:hypothetical protein
MRFGGMRPLALAAGLIAAGCGSASDSLRTPGMDEYNPGSRRERAASLMGSGQGILVFGTDRSRRPAEADATGIGVNAFLWRATLDTLGFLPITSADPFGGVVISDWYQPPGTRGERFRATAYILGRELRSDAVRVTVFRQVQQGGSWVDSPTSPATNAEFEDRILARARELRAQSLAAAR